MPPLSPPVETADAQTCGGGPHGRGGGPPRPLPSPSGFLHGPSRSPPGGPCVRSLSAAPGQRINLTLYDFGTDPPALLPAPAPGGAAPGGARGGPEGLQGLGVCRRLALVTDVVAKTDVDVCSSHARVSHAYLTAGHGVEIRLLRGGGGGEAAGGSGGRHFLLHYEGTLLWHLYGQI